MTPSEYYKNVTNVKRFFVKKLLVVILLFIASMLYWLKVPEPLNAFVSFIIGGDVPGTSIVLGFWPTVGFGVFCLYLLKRFVTHIRLQSLEYTSNQIRSEQEKRDFEKANQHDFDKRSRSVIAGPSSEPVI